MKGVVFVKFLDMVEGRFGALRVERLIEESDSPAQGAYMSAGNYDPADLVKMVGALSRAEGIPVPDLLRTFGAFMFEYFLKTYRQYFDTTKDLFGFLKSVESRIHVDVNKLYHDADLPTFSYDDSQENCLVMTYRSKRNLPDLAEGLIRSAAEFYAVPITLDRMDRQDPQGPVTQFVIRR